MALVQQLQQLPAIWLFDESNQADIWRTLQRVLGQAARGDLLLESDPRFRFELKHGFVASEPQFSEAGGVFYASGLGERVKAEEADCPTVERIGHYFMPDSIGHMKIELVWPSAKAAALTPVSVHARLA